MLREEVTILKSDVNARDEEVKKYAFGSVALIKLKLKFVYMYRLWTQNVELRASLTSSREGWQSIVCRSRICCRCLLNA